MIARVWKGWTRKQDADAYEKLLKETVYPGLRKIKGYLGGYILRSEIEHEIEFITVNFFETIDVVKKFAGDDYTTPVFEPEAKKLLARIEPIARHYDVRQAP